jgi:hypothetical protein
MGHADLQWACSEAAVLVRRAHPPGQTYLGRLEKKPGQGKALTVLAHKLARALYDLLQRHTAFDMHTFLTGERSGAGAPGAYLATAGISLGPMF